MRSLLFVPGDSERKIAKGLASDADALILDLEDAVAPDRKPTARALCAEVLAQARGSGKRLVRLDGRMLDRPQLRAAERVIARTRAPV